MLKFVIKRNCQNPATGDIESTFDTFEVSVPLIETALDREWGGIKDASVVECRILKEAAEASTQPITKQGRLEDSTQICPHFDWWTIFGSKGEVMYRIPACINQGKLLPC
jgi:hypothetical protein